MMKVRHRQTGETREIPRFFWELPGSEYQKLKHVWAVLDEGDPVTLIRIDDNGQEQEGGLVDRDQALALIKRDTKRWYIKEIDKVAGLISKVLLDVGENRLSLMVGRGPVDDYQRAVVKAKELGLLKEYTENSYGLTHIGREAVELGGYEKWKVYNENSELQDRTVKQKESGLIDQVLNDAQEHYISLMRDTPPDYQKAVEKAKRHGLLKAVSKTSYELTDEGYSALDLGGFDFWKEHRAQKERSQYNQIHVGGNAVIGDGNMGVDQSRDSKNQSPTLPISQQPKAIPNPKPIKTSDHTIWDKVKYISAIVGAIGALVAAAVAISKAVGWLT